MSDPSAGSASPASEIAAADPRGEGQSPRHFVWKVTAFVALVVVVLMLAGITRDRYLDDRGSNRAPEATVDCKDRDDSVSVLVLAKTVDHCRALTTVKNLAALDRLDRARAAVLWNFAAFTVCVGLIVWACSLELRSIRQRLAALLAIAMAVGAWVLNAFVTVRLLLILNRQPGNDITRIWTDLTGYADHLKWPLLAGSAIFGAYAALSWLIVTLRKEAYTPPAPPRHIDRDVVAENAGIPAPRTPDPLPTLRERFRFWVLGIRWEPEVPPPDPPSPKRDTVGICCSGGGVRSAAFNLGALQALQDHDRYQDARYLAAVSGGSYIAAGFAVVANQSDADVVTPTEPPFARGSPEEQYLRNHSSYLAPGLVGKLSLGWRLLRGLAVNLALLFLVLLAVGMPLGWSIANGQADAGAPSRSKALLASAESFQSSADSAADDTTPYSVRAADGSTVVLPNHEKLALRKGSVVRVRAGTVLELMGSPRVVVTPPEDRTQDVALPALATRPVVGRLCDRDGKCTIPTMRVAESRDVEPARQSEVRLTTGVTRKLSPGDRLDLATGSRIVVDEPVLLQVSEDAVVDAASGEVIDLCGDSRCVEHDVTSVERWVIGSVVFVGLVLTLLPLIFRPKEWVTQIMEAWGTRILVFAGALFLALVALPELVEWLRDREGQPGFQLSRISVSGVIAVVIAVVLDLTGARGTSVSGTAATIAGVRNALSKAAPAIRNAFVSVVGAVIGPLAVIAAFLAIVIWASDHGLGVGQATIVASAGVAIVLVEVTGDLTRWSMHPFYKARLRSAYALERETNPKGRPVATYVDYDVRIPLSGLGPQNPNIREPELVVCAAANLSDPGAEPPGRPVSTFTFSKTHVGGGWLGLLDPGELETAAAGSYGRDVSLPAAVAMSGAALSPAMGKFTKRRYTFLMALANVRLGVWLPNPLHVTTRVKLAHQKLAKDHQDDGSDGPASAPPLAPTSTQSSVWAFQAVARPHYLFKEMLGLTSFKDHFVYVTDGGHFENLGLVELLRRGCTNIYCFDASGGDIDSFATLGQAIAIARSELSVEITINPKPATANGDSPDASGIHVGRIRYEDDDRDSPLIFVRATVDDGAPWDVRAYRERDPQFPTNSTLDQLYTDEKFEAYRALGYYQATKAIAAMDDAVDAV